MSYCCSWSVLHFSAKNCTFTSFQTIQRAGAISVTILVTHGVFSKGALRTLESYGDFIKSVVVTNSIPQTRLVDSGRLKSKLHVLDVSGKCLSNLIFNTVVIQLIPTGLIAEFVRRHHYRESVSVLGRFMPIRDNEFGDGLRGMVILYFFYWDQSVNKWSVQWSE